MIIECTSCHAKYQYSEDRFERKPSKKIKCAKCGTIFEIQNPAFASKPAAGARPDAGDRTFTSRDAKPKPQETTDHSPLPQHATDATKVALSLPHGKRLSIAIIDGPDAGSVYRLEKPRVTIGRANADLNINDTEASRQHAALEIRDTIYLLEDLGSTNGTMIDGRKIEEPTEIQDKSEFQVGTTVLMLIVTEDV